MIFDEFEVYKYKSIRVTPQIIVEYNISFI